MKICERTIDHIICGETYLPLYYRAQTYLTFDSFPASHITMAHQRRHRDEDLDSEFEYASEKRRKTWRDDPLSVQRPVTHQAQHSVAIPSKQLVSVERDKEEWRARRFHLLSMDAYSRQECTSGTIIVPWGVAIVCTLTMAILCEVIVCTLAMAILCEVIVCTLTMAILCEAIVCKYAMTILCEAIVCTLAMAILCEVIVCKHAMAILCEYAHSL